MKDGKRPPGRPGTTPDPDFVPNHRQGFRVKDEKGTNTLTDSGQEAIYGSGKTPVHDFRRSPDVVRPPAPNHWPLQPTPKSQLGARQDTGGGGGKFPKERRPDRGK